jgi:hypothetical protein
MKTTIDLDCWENDNHEFNIIIRGSVTGAKSPEELAEYIKNVILNNF